jgi:hypothetical protein
METDQGPAAPIAGFFSPPPAGPNDISGLKNLPTLPGIETNSFAASICPLAPRAAC